MCKNNNIWKRTINSEMYAWDKLKLDIHEKWRKWWIEVHPSNIGEYSWNYLFTDGKEIRPKLFCELWQYLSPDLKINAELAFAIECIHVASLILDDTGHMDNANQRRGKPTLHITYSTKDALLITNNVIYMAVEIWKNNNPEHIPQTIWQRILISKLQRLTIGQKLDLEKKGNLIELASLKTGILFEVVCETVAHCLHLDTDFWNKWGNYLGILFQWMDDYLDMDEDITQNNRNAFNESFDITLENYKNIWNKLEKDIGEQWFERPFGKFMKLYFLDKIPITINTNNYKSLSDICIPLSIDLIIPDILSNEINDEKEFRYINDFIIGLSRKNIIERLYKMSENIFLLSVIQANEWNN
jgi:hypothetical protein